MSQNILLAQRLFALLLVLCLGFSASVRAESSDEEAIASIRNVLTTTQPNMVIAEIKPSPVPDLFEVRLQNSQTIYVSRDARFLIPGELYESRDDGLVNLSELRGNELRHEKLLALNEADMIVYEPEGGRKATITVFTDVDCPYCRKLHGEIEELNKFGIAVRYLAYPRTGLIDGETGQLTETTVRMISTWCAEDRNAMMTSAKRGGDIPVIECDSPVEEQYQLGREVGVKGTPALVLEDGTMLPGYIPAAELAKYLLGDAAGN
jgi:thiol:disulfide interchange protein DsbC